MPLCRYAPMQLCPYAPMPLCRYAPPSMPIRIIIADDHPIILDGLVHLFTTANDINVVTRCSDGDDALGVGRRARPDVLGRDVRMPRRNGIEVLREIHREQIPTRVV